MPKPVDRRTVLLGLGAGAAAGFASPRFAGWRAGAAGTNARRPISAEDLAALAKRFRETPRGEVLGVAAKAIAAGADRSAILGAVFLAGVEEIRPHPVGNFLHNVMMVESAFLLTEGAPAEETWLAALWALDDFKASQQADERRGDWVLPPPKAPNDALASEEKARKELYDALSAYDPERADRAVTALLAHVDPDEAFQTVWPYATRSFHDAGHRILHSAQVHRTLRRIDRACALPALRTVVIGLADDSEGSDTAAFVDARSMGKEIPERWLEGSEAPEKSLEVLRALRCRTPKESQRAVVDAFREGLGPTTIWDGIRLYASELMLLRPTREHLFPVHTVTEVEAFGHAWDSAKHDWPKRLIVLQAAAWLAMVRDAVVANNGPYSKACGIDALGETGDGKELAEAVAARSPDGVASALREDSALASAYVAGLRSHLVRKGDQNHQFKYAGSILVESGRGDPRWRTRFLAVGVDYLPGASASVTELCRRSRYALTSAGVG